MLHIRTEQEETMAEEAMRRFAVESVPFLKAQSPAWCETRGDEELERFVDSMIAFAHENYIYKAANIRTLMALRTEFDFAVPLTGYLHAKTVRPDFDEDYRVEHLSRVLESGRQLIVIKMDTDLEALRRRHDG